MTTTNAPTRGFTLNRTIQAPRDQVFRAWTDPAHMTWFLNDHQPTPDEPIEVDLRVGGVWRLMMVVGQRTRYFTGGLYLAIEVPEKLVFAWGATDGWPELDPNDLEHNPIVTLLLELDGDRTSMTLDVRLPESMSDDKVREWLESGMRPGWSDTIDRLVVAAERDPGLRSSAA